MTPEQKQLILSMISAIEAYDKSATAHRRYLRDELIKKVKEVVK